MNVAPMATLALATWPAAEDTAPDPGTGPGDFSAVSVEDGDWVSAVTVDAGDWIEARAVDGT